MAALNPFQLYQGQPGNTTTTCYTVNNTAGLYVILKDIIICNVTASSVVLSMSIVPSGGTEGDTNRIIRNWSIPGYATVEWTGTQVMGQNVSLRATAGAASSLTVTASGVKNY